VQSYIDTRNPLNPFVAYDPSTKEVHFNLNDDKTLIFNEDLSIFNSFYTYNPEYYIQSDSSLMSINSGSIWAHNYKMADYSYKNRFYNGDRFVSKIKIVSNKSYNNSKIFDSMDFLTQAYKCENIFSSGALTYTIKDDPITTFNSVKFSTIRDTDIAELTTGERKLIYNKEEPSDYELGYTKREESFTLFIPRVFTIDSDDELFKPRMRGKFMVINLETGKYDDDNKFLGRRFSLSYIISKFRYSIR
jgi:hypothetical protein